MHTSITRWLFRILLAAVVGGAAGWGMWRENAKTVKSAAVPAPSSLVKVARDRLAPPTVSTELSDQRELCERLRGASVEQMRDMLLEVQRYPDAFRQRLAREFILEQMARTDPVKAIDMRETWEEGRFRSYFMKFWAEADIEGALAWASEGGRENGGRGLSKRDYLSVVMDAFGPENLESFVNLLPRLKADPATASRLAGPFGHLAAKDPQRALQLMEDLPEWSGRASVVAAVGESWARRDVGAAYAWAKELADPAQRESALREVFRVWAETDPQGVAARLDELSTDSAVTRESFGRSPEAAIIRAWAEQDPQAAAAWARERGVAADGRELREVLASDIFAARPEWSATEVAAILRRPGEPGFAEPGRDPFATTTSLDTLDETLRYIGSFGGGDSLLHGTAATGHMIVPPRIENPPQAFDDLARQPADAARQHVLHEVAAQWVERDPSAVAAKLAHTTDDWLKLSLINALSQHARQTGDPELAKSAARALPEGHEFAASMQTGVYQAIAEREPERARALLQGGEMDERSQSAVVSILAGQQAAFDPLGAVAWAAEQAAPALQTQAMHSAVAGWAKTDAYEASGWLAEQPPGPLRDAAVTGLVQAIGRSDPEDALHWAASLSDSGEREARQVEIVSDLMSRQPQKARQLAAELTLSVGARQELQQRLEAKGNPGR